MELALIPPKCLLDDTNKTEVQLMLPQLLEMREGVELDDYSFTYLEHCKDSLQFVIMDNGAAEAKQMPFEQLIKIIRAYEPDEFALPDVLGNSTETLISANTFFKMHQEDLDKLNLRRTEELLLGFVAQGKTVAEAVNTIDIMRTYSWSTQVSTIYIPRLLIKETGNPFARLEVLAQLYARYGSEFEYHLFGAAATYPDEILDAVTYNELRSMDTSLPYVMSFARRGFDDEGDWSKELKRPDNYFDLSSEKFHYHARNVSFFLEACK